MWLLFARVKRINILWQTFSPSIVEIKDVKKVVRRTVWSRYYKFSSNAVTREPWVVSFGSGVWLPNRAVWNKAKSAKSCTEYETTRCSNSRVLCFPSCTYSAHFWDQHKISCVSAETHMVLPTKHQVYAEWICRASSLFIVLLGGPKYKDDFLFESCSHLHSRLQQPIQGLLINVHSRGRTQIESK
jgi:hypothetical protein